MAVRTTDQLNIINEYISEEYTSMVIIDTTRNIYSRYAYQASSISALDPNSLANCFVKVNGSWKQATIM